MQIQSPPVEACPLPHLPHWRSQRSPVYPPCPLPAPGFRAGPSSLPPHLSPLLTKVPTLFLWIGHFAAPHFVVLYSHATASAVLSYHPAISPIVQPFARWRPIELPVVHTDHTCSPLLILLGLSLADTHDSWPAAKWLSPISAAQSLALAVRIEPINQLPSCILMRHQQWHITYTA